MAFYYDSKSELGGYVTFGALDYFYYHPTPGQFGIPNFTQNDHFTTKSTSFFAHAVWQVTDRLSLTGGVRETDETKTFAFDHTNIRRSEESCCRSRACRSRGRRCRNR